MTRFWGKAGCGRGEKGKGEREGEKQIPFGNDNKKGRGEGEGEGEKQIPFGNDNKKGKGEGEGE